MRYSNLIILLICSLIATSSTSHAETAFDITSLDRSAMSTGGKVINVDFSGTQLKSVYPSAPISNVTGTLTTASTFAGVGALARRGFLVLNRAFPYVAVASTGYMLYSDLRAIVQNDPARYPTLNQLMSGSIEGKPGTDYNVGDWISFGSKYGTIKSKTWNPSVMSNSNYPTGIFQNGAGISILVALDAYRWAGYYTYYIGPNSPAGSAPVVPATDAEIAANFANANALQGPAGLEFEQAYANHPEKMQVPITPGQVQALQSGEESKANSATALHQDTLEQIKNQLQEEYNQNPTPEKLRELQKAIADLAKAQADQAKADQLAPPALPPENTYDTTIDVPEKKSIMALLLDFTSDSPLKALVDSFTITTSDLQDKISVGTVYGQPFEFDFSRYDATFASCGGVLLIIAHGFAILIVIKGW